MKFSRLSRRGVLLDLSGLQLAVTGIAAAALILGLYVGAVVMTFPVIGICVALAFVGVGGRKLVEWGPLGVRVNAVAPGYIETDLTRDLIERGVISPTDIANRTPLRRFGRTADLLGVVLLLLSPHSEFVTGQVLPVDGGWLANGYFK